MALEPNHGTLPVDDLANSDLLYIAGLNRQAAGVYEQGYVRVLLPLVLRNQ